MTLLERLRCPPSCDDVFIVNGCLDVRITSREAREADYVMPGAYSSLVLQRILPLMWLAMPGHDLSRF